MEWLPEDADFLTVLGAVLAAGTALLGLTVGISQLSVPSRARKVVEWTSSALERENDTSRKVVLQALKLRAQGSLISSQLVPGRLFGESIAWSLLAPTAIVIVSNRSDGQPVWTYIFTTSIVMTLVFRRAIRLYAERQRVRYQFAEGTFSIKSVRVDILEQMEGGTRVEFALGFICAVSLVGTGGFLAKAIIEGREGTMWFWAGLGVFACWCCAKIVHAHALKLALQPPPQAEKI
ncbi:hypothetical protein ACWIDS_07345 [Dietzia maris]